ncbi:unnamed protein product, partial [Urochloa humidicola]
PPFQPSSSHPLAAPAGAACCALCSPSPSSARRRLHLRYRRLLRHLLPFFVLRAPLPLSYRPISPLLRPLLPLSVLRATAASPFLRRMFPVSIKLVVAGRPCSNLSFLQHPLSDAASPPLNAAAIAHLLDVAGLPRLCNAGSEQIFTSR